MNVNSKNYTYILECSDGTLYTGWTNDLENRIRTHNAGNGAKYTKARLPVSLLYYEVYDTKSQAMRRECQIKKMTRAEKLELIKNNVPEVIYAIYCKEDNKVVWNARGSAYKNPLDVEKKLAHLEETNPDKTYRIIKYRLDQL